MGTNRHNAIVVTLTDILDFEEIATTGRALGLTILGPSEEGMNGVSSLLVCPDGSNEGRDVSDRGDRDRAAFIQMLAKKQCAGLSWVEVRFGGCGSDATIVSDSHAGKP